MSEQNNIGKCPKCSGDIISGKNSFFCSNYKDETVKCEFGISRTIMGAIITEEDIKKLLNKEDTSEKEFTWKSGNKGKATLRLSENFSLEFSFVNKEIGKCPKCGKPVLEKKNFYLCEDYKSGCDFGVKKEIQGSTITLTDIKALLAGKETEEKEFTWKSGKTGKAKLVCKDGKVDFSFTLQVL